MGRRNVVPKFQVYTSKNSTTAGPSLDTDVSQVDNVKYIVIIEAAVNVLARVEFCDDKNQNEEVWKPLDFGVTLPLIGSIETEYEFLIEKAVAYKLRINFSNNGGNGLINAWYSSSNEGA